MRLQTPFVLLTLILLTAACSGETNKTEKEAATDAPVVMAEKQAITAVEDTWLAFGTGGHVSKLDAEGVPEVVWAKFLRGQENIQAMGPGSGPYLLLTNESTATFNGQLKQAGTIQEAFSKVGETVDAIGYSGDNENSWLFVGGDSQKKVGLFSDGSLASVTVEGTSLPNSKAVAISFLKGTPLEADSWGILFENGGAFVLKIKANGAGEIVNTSDLTIPAGEKFTGLISVESRPGWTAFTETRLFKFNRVSFDNAAGESIPGLVGAEKVVTANSELKLLGTDQGAILELDGTRHQLLSEKIVYIAEASDFDKFLVVGESLKMVLVNKNTLAQVGSETQAKLPGSTPPSKLMGVALAPDDSTSEKYWVFGFENGLLMRLKEDLSDVVTDPLANLLNNNTIDASATGKGKILIAGTDPNNVDNGIFQLVDPDGTHPSELKTIDGFGGISAAVWTGSHFVIGSRTGKIQSVRLDGSLKMETPQTTDIQNINFMSFNGTNILTGGDDGKAALLRPSGTKLQDVEISPMKNGSAVSADFSASPSDQFWLVVGHDSTQGKAAKVRSNGTVAEIGSYKNFTEIYTSVKSAGASWYVGNVLGEAVLVRPGGDKIIDGTAKQKIFRSSPITGFARNGGTFLVYGEGGRVSKFSTGSANAIESNAVYISNSGTNIDSVTPNTPFMFAGGKCSNSTTFQCIGVPCINNAFCCDRPCNGTCESCKGEDTGKADGVCAPVLAGRSGNNCNRQDPKYCGTTGVCDGNGACKVYDSSTTCAQARCESNTYYEPASCPGDGSSCPAQTETSCSPYKGCDATAGCATTCTDDDGCVDGFACKNNQCVAKSSDPSQNGNGNASGSGTSGGGAGKSEDKGCSSTNSGSAPLLVLLLAAGAFVVRRRRED